MFRWRVLVCGLLHRLLSEGLVSTGVLQCVAVCGSVLQGAALCWFVAYCIYVCTCAPIHACTCVHMCVCICIYICVCMCMYVCMCIYTCVYEYIYIGHGPKKKE